MILAVDTSLPMLSIALTSEGETLGALAVRGEGSRNEKLLPAVDWLLTECGTELAAIELFVVTRGPGSFTGLRIGLATVQGMATVLDRPICAIPTHEAALGGSHSSRLLVFSEAGRGEFYASTFDAGRASAQTRIVSAGELESMRGAAGEAIDLNRFAEETNLALLAARRAASIRAAGELDRYRDPLPLYVRLAEADARVLGRPHE
jgi:tRNA threonylcarbamoyl adenosine modification protein YeaZ